MEITYNTKIKLHPLSIRQEKSNYIVEDTLKNEFYEMPKVCIEAIEMIEAYIHLKQIEEKLSKFYDKEEVDIIDFVHQLIDLEIVSEIDGVSITENIAEKKEAGFYWIPERLGQILFNRFTTKLYFGMFIASFFIFIFNPSLIPHYKDIFIFDLMIENVLAVIIITMVLVVLHEMGHIIAIRGENLNAKLELGHRLFFAVLETDLTQSWKLSPTKRNKLLFAGMYIDITVIFTSLVLLLLIKSNNLFSSILGIVIFNTVIRLIYQLCVFMKTDFYYIIENMTGCYNLMENGQNYLSKWLPFLKVSHTETFAGEEKVVRGYAIFYLTGVLLTVAIAAKFYVPQIIFAMKEFMLPGLTEPFNSLRFWDSAVFLLQIGIVSGLLIYSWSKKYRLSR